MTCPAGHDCRLLLTTPEGTEWWTCEPCHYAGRRDA